MSLREKLQSKPGRVAAVGFLVLAVSAGFGAYQFANRAEAHAGNAKAFYSVDDGQTWFIDDAERVSGFEHEGQPAYRAYLFRAGEGLPFVGYLERFTPQAREQVVAQREGADPPGGAMQERQLYMQGQEIKKPGDAQWHRRGTPQAGTVLRIQAPDGSLEPLEPVLP